MSYVLPFCVALLYISSLSTSITTNDVKRDHCNKTVDIYEDVSSPEVTLDNVGRPMTCWYRFRSFRGTPKDWVIRLRFKKFKVGTLVNASYCHNGYIQIIDGNAKTDLSNRKEPGLFCGETEQQQTFISETSYVKIFFHVDNFTDQTYFSLDSRAEQEFDVYLRYGQHPELYPNRRGQIVTGSYCERIFQDCRLQTCYVQSPAYPGIYPRHLHCSYHMNTHLPFIKLYIENEEFNIDGQRCENIMTCPMRPISSGSQNCPYDYIRIYDGKNSSSPEIGTFCGMGKFPYSIIGTGSDLFVQFFSSAAGPLLNTGFHFNVGNWPGHVETAGSRNGTCNWLLTSQDLEASGNSEGIFLSIPHWYPPHISCTYLIQGKPGQIVRLYFPSFRINRIESPITMFEGDCGESLTLYDSSWSDDSNIIKTFCDTFSRVKEKHDFVSTGNSLLVKFESKTGSYSGSSLYYWAHYDFFNNTKFGRAVPETFCDEVFTSWDSTDGYLRSPLNTLVYKRAEIKSSLRCIYKFITDRRLFARIILTVTAVNFKDTMPCNECWEERIDKLIIFEPSPPSNTSTRNHCLCNNLNTKSSKPVIIISKSETLNIELIIDSAHSSKYFKHPNPLFEATYKFIHSPVCGPAFLPAVPEGEIYFPHKTPEPSQFVHCLWEIQINRDRDVWIHFDTIRFVTRDCKDGRIDMFLTSKLEPFTICGHNMSAKDIPILTSEDLFVGALPFVKIQYIGTTPNVAFKIAWTELLHLPHNIDGSSITSKLTDNSFADSSQTCEFLCPGEPSLCIPASLVCNGIVNCPISHINDSIIIGGDESIELCMIKTEVKNFNWIVIGLSSCCLVLVVIFCCCRGCIKLHCSDNDY